MQTSTKQIEELSTLAKDLGFDQFDWIAYEKPISASLFTSYLDQNKNAKMKWLEDSAKQRLEPKTNWSWLNSSLVLTYPYFPETNVPPSTLKSVRIASYAKNSDYHFWIKDKLQTLIDYLKSEFPTENFLAAVDSLPILERDLAYQAGMGWFGKNTCLIHPKKGSLFFICEILTSLKIERTLQPIPDFCGKCQKCIEICPTKALSPKSLDSNLCISYWTIESRLAPPTNLAKNFGDWFFGCDLCQTVCPWNEKIFKNQLDAKLTSSRTSEEQQALIHELQFFLTASGKQIQKRVKGTPLLRAGPFGLRKNAIIVVANLKIQKLKPAVIPYLEDSKFKDLANWCLSELE